MKKISTYGAGLLFAAMNLALGACSEFEPTGYPEVPYLAKAYNVTAEVTRRTVPLGIVPDNMAPTVFSSGAGGDGTDIWTINPYLGWQFKEEEDA